MIDLPTAAKRAREHGADDPMAMALAAEIERRGPAPEQGDRDAPAPVGHNNPPVIDERAVFKTRLEESEEAKALADRNAALEMAAAKLPKAEAIKTEDDIAKIDAWVGDAVALLKDLKGYHERTKAPYLMRGQVIDEFRREMDSDIDKRMSGMQARKRPFLLAKAERERAERAAAAAAERKAAAEQRARGEAELEKAAAAQRLADEEASRLARVEADRAEAEASAFAQADADETTPDLTQVDSLTGAVDAAEDDLRSAEFVADQHNRAADAAREAGLAAEQRAIDAEAAAMAPTHVLSKVGESGLKSVWRWKITSPKGFLAGHPLISHLTDRETGTLLDRAAKADPRPTVPGVEFFEDYDVTTTKARR